MKRGEHTSTPLKKQELEMETNIRVGDTVQLRVGGMLMSVNSLRGEPAEYVNCVWHDKSMPCKEIYAIAALVRITRDEVDNA
jgi:uncharacterized protein YodC (DUF2158 family)